MPLLDLFALLLCVVAALAFVNARFLKLPSSIGVMVGGLVVSLLLLGLGAWQVPWALAARELVRGVQFDDLLFQGILSFLLFAGALGVHSPGLWAARRPVLSFALLSTLISTLLIGWGMSWLLFWLGFEVPLLYCFLFGALISPTDPVSVLGMLKQAKVPQRIETLVAGESLLNDGVGVVLFSLLAGLALSSGHGAELSVLGVGQLFVQETLGGLALGVVAGALGYLLLRAVDDFATEMLLSLGLVVGLTAIAHHWHVSGPLAAVAAGLLVGSLTDRQPSALSNKERYEEVWHLLDELLNVLLFALLALEVMALSLSSQTVVLGLCAIPLVLLARALSVQLPVMVLSRQHNFDPFTRRLLVWGGLRGAISVALAFSVPPGPARELFLVVTYVVVVFSVIVQGLSVGRLAQQAGAAREVPDVEQVNTKLRPYVRLKREDGSRGRRV